MPGTERALVGSLLADALARQGLRCSSVSVINDTVAALLAGAANRPADAQIRLIVGTGTNMAAFFRGRDICKLAPDVGPEVRFPVNLESGNYAPPYLTDADRRVADESGDAQAQLFEKAVSGAYLARVLLAALPGLSLDPESGSEGVVAVAQSAACACHSQVAAAILERSARLVAASLAGLVACLSARQDVSAVTIAAEGSLFWNAPGYGQAVSSTLRDLLHARGLGSVDLSIERIESANLLGSAFAALSRG